MVMTKSRDGSCSSCCRAPAASRHGVLTKHCWQTTCKTATVAVNASSVGDFGCFLCARGVTRMLVIVLQSPASSR
jgi:hypothetical protein